MIGNRAFFVFGIGGEFDDFHTVEQGGGNAFVIVGSSNKDAVREVHRQFGEVITEGFVLFRIQHFQQCRCGVAHLARRELIDLVKDEDGVHHAGVRQCINDAPRLCRDIGLAVSTNIGFVTDAAEGNACAGALHGAGDREGNRCFTDTGRTD